MTNRWIPRLGVFFTLLLSVAGLVFLQVTNAEAALLSCLPAYGLIAIAALIAIATLRSSSRLDLPCLYTTGAFFAYIALRSLHLSRTLHCQG